MDEGESLLQMNHKHDQDRKGTYAVEAVNAPLVPYYRFQTLLFLVLTASGGSRKPCKDFTSQGHSDTAFERGIDYRRSCLSSETTLL